jgi:ribonucleotide monophosphatase NagD (HAD superfamily)
LIDGVKHPETAAYVAAIHGFVGRKPDVISGKPNPLMFSILKNSYPNIENGRTCMVGDRLDTDMAFARNSGILKMMTFSGVTQARELESLLDTDIDFFIHYLGRIYEIIKSN